MIFSRRHIAAIGGIFLLALVFRLPYIRSPHATLFDEGLFTTFTMKYAQHDPYFDVHPQLAPMLFSFVAGYYEKPSQAIFDIGSSFQTFPFARIRVLNVILGSLLAAIVAAISLFLWGDSIFAYLPGVLVAIDNAYILYSRVILPDTMLVFFGFAGVLCFLIADHRRLKILYIVSGVLIGCAASVKWNGLGFIAAPLLLLLLKRSYKEIAYMIGAAIVVYVAVFVMFFWHFNGSPVISKYLVEREPFYQYPASGLLASISFLPRHTAIMYRAHKEVPNHDAASKPWYWPFGYRSIGFSNGDRSILFIPNYLAWWFAFAAVLISAYIVVRRATGIYRMSSYVFSLVGYASLYFPLYFAGRHLFMYLYLSPVVFGYLLVPPILKWIAASSFPAATERRIAIIFTLIMLFGTFVGAFYTYGLVKI